MDGASEYTVGAILLQPDDNKNFESVVILHKRCHRRSSTFEVYFELEKSIKPSQSNDVN